MGRPDSEAVSHTVRVPAATRAAIPRPSSSEPTPRPRHPFATIRLPTQPLWSYFTVVIKATARPQARQTRHPGGKAASRNSSSQAPLIHPSASARARNSGMSCLVKNPISMLPSGILRQLHILPDEPDRIGTALSAMFELADDVLVGPADLLQQFR